ncbi:MAG: FGGY-family carbohydrate kinase [Planctomycetota bacterium]
MSLLGLDIGTTGVKAVAFREDGSFLASAYEEYDLRSPAPGHLELDPREVLAAIRSVTSSVGEKTRGDPIRSVAACTLGEAAVPVDRSGNPLGNAIIGFDARGQDEERTFRERLSTEEVFEITGHGTSSSHTLFKILWRRAHEPETFRKAHRFLCFGDFLASALGVPARMEHSVAARTLAFDIHRLDWSRRILDAADLPVGIFPPVAAPGEPLGEIGEGAAREFGLPKGCVVAGGLHDQPAGILGAAVEPGESMLAIGTVICLGVRLKGKPAGTSMARNNLCYYPTFGERQYVSLAFNFTGGSLLKWYRDQLAGPEIAEAERLGADPYDAITAGLPEGPTGLLVLPHFTTTGTPWLDPRALGAVFGLRLTTGRKEIVKAILEGILYEIRLNAELLESAGVAVERYKAIGGAAKSPVWMQIAADILGEEVAVTTVTEGAALGAALMGAKAAGIAPTVGAVEEIARRAARVERVLEPRPAHARLYAERFEVYRGLYPATREISHRLFELARG